MAIGQVGGTGRITQSLVLRGGGRVGDNDPALLRMFGFGTTRSQSADGENVSEEDISHVDKLAQQGSNVHRRVQYRDVRWWGERIMSQRPS